MEKRKIDVTANAVWTKEGLTRQRFCFSMIDCDTRLYPDFSATCTITFRPTYNAYLGKDVFKGKEYMLAQSLVMRSVSEKAIKAKVRRWYNKNINLALRRAIQLLEEGFIEL